MNKYILILGILIVTVLVAGCISDNNYKQIDMHVNKHITDKWFDQQSYFARTSDYNVYETSKMAWDKIDVGGNYNLCITFTTFVGTLKSIPDSTFVYDVIPINSSEII